MNKHIGETVKIQYAYSKDYYNGSTKFYTNSIKITCPFCKREVYLKNVAKDTVLEVNKEFEVLDRCGKLKSFLIRYIDEERELLYARILS